MKKRGAIVSESLLIILILILVGMNGLITIQNINPFFNQITGRAGQAQGSCQNQPDGCLAGSPPIYCEGQVAVDACDLCGCPSGRDCIDGVCQKAGGPAEPSCGDGTCNGGETCSTCSQDCGQCAQGSPSGGGSSGGGSSGSGGSDDEETTGIIHPIEEPETYQYTPSRTESSVKIKKEDIIKTIFQETEYDIKISYVSDYSVVLSISNDIIAIKAGQSSEIDLNEDSQNDIKITYFELLENNKASLKLEELPKQEKEVQTSPITTQVKRPERQTNTIAIYFTIAIALLIIASALIRQSIIEFKSKKNIKKKNKR